MKKLLSLTGCLGFVAVLSGCMDGPGYSMKRMNPYFQSNWRKDRELGPTFEDRIEELRLLESQLASMPPDEKEQWAQRLEKIVRDDPSPEMRSRAVSTISKIGSEASERALKSASGDEVEKVRLAVCKAWSNRGGTAAQDMLLTLATSDQSNNVRQAAVDALGSFNDPEVVRTLATLLEDRSPAVQYEVAQSLAALTGEDFGGDISEWKTYINAMEGVTQPDAIGMDPQILSASGTTALPR